MNLKTKLVMSIAALNLALCSIPANAANNTFNLINATAMLDSGSNQLPSLAPVLENVIPAVVNISVEGKKTVGNDMMELPEQFRFFFPNIQPSERPFKALGSGVVIDAKNRYVVTNNHVVDGADKIIVTFNDGKEFEATKVGADAQTDCAVLKLNKKPDTLVELKFADSDSIRVGDFAIAIGNPFGLGQTVTSGIISGLGRTGLNIENYENFIQTDAAINSGNSGGALVNLRGELIGINTAILGKAGGNIGIGFAIPSNMIKSIVDQIIEHGTVKRGMLGIKGSEVSDELAKNFGYDKSNGAFVNEVIKDGAAAKAGIKSGDILTSINGTPITSFAQMRAKIATFGAGTKVTIGIFRDGKEITTDVVLSSNTELDISDSQSIDNTLFKGAKFSNYKDNEGVKVDSVEAKSPAASLPLVKGDIIIEVNKKTVKNTKDLEKAINSKSKFIAVKILRGNAVIYITRSF